MRVLPQSSLKFFLEMRGLPSEQDMVEFKIIILRLKNNKAPWQYDINSELLKNCRHF